MYIIPGTEKSSPHVLDWIDIIKLIARVYKPEHNI